MSFTTCLLRLLPPFLNFFYFTLCDGGMISSFVSAASDVNPSNVAGQKTAEPAVAVENAAQQTTQEQTEGQPMVVTAAETAERTQLGRGPERAPLQGMMRLQGRLPRAASRSRETEPRLRRLLKDEGPQLHPGRRLLRQRAPLAGVRVL